MARRILALEAVMVESKSKRRSLAINGAEVAKAASAYFASGANKNLEYFSSGCRLLDEALGIGYVLGRVVNIVGDRSSGKTLLAIEACANFHRKYSKGRIRYAEAEAAFDESYAEALGMPIEAVDFTKNREVATIEDFYKDMSAFIKSLKGEPGLYVLDSLDALSDEAEQKREIDDGSYGGNKAKKLGEMFRRLIAEMESSRVTLIVISQIRDKLNVTFGETKTRSGGRALDFYATHIIWLAQIGKLKRTVQGVERTYGVNVRANIKKNKVGPAFREVDFPVLFGYGVDDLTAGVEWLIEVKHEERLDELGLTKSGYKVKLNNMRDKGGEPTRVFREQLNSIVSEVWSKIEQNFLPKSGKY